MAKTLSPEQRYRAIVEKIAQHAVARDKRSNCDAARAQALEKQLEALSVEVLLRIVHKAETLFDETPIDRHDLPSDLADYVERATDALEELSRQIHKHQESEAE